MISGSYKEKNTSRNIEFSQKIEEKRPLSPSSLVKTRLKGKISFAGTIKSENPAGIDLWLTDGNGVTYGPFGPFYTFDEIKVCSMSEISEITKVALRQDQGASIIKTMELEMEDSGKIFSFDLNEEIKVQN